MKKTLALMMAAVLLLSLLCACGGEDKAKGSEGEWKDPALPDYVMGKPLPPDGAIFGLSRFAGGGSGFQGSAASSPHAEAPNK